jgi:hypothetical protein
LVRGFERELEDGNQGVEQAAACTDLSRF